MTAQLLDGKRIAADLRQHIKTQVERHFQQTQSTPGLAVILVGENPASQVYVRNKQNACEAVGIHSELIQLSNQTTQNDLLKLIDTLNHRTDINGILVQLPLPEHINDHEITERIRPDKDVDGFHPYNIGRLALRKPLLRPCTPKGVMTLLQHADTDLSGKDAVIIGQSNIVGRPMFMELLMARCTPTICHSKTRELAAKLKQADILIAAIGVPEFIQGGWLKPGAIVIDVGINRGEDDGLCGDVDFISAKETAGWITPVPGGVGPMTVATLLQNTLQATEIQQSSDHSHQRVDD